jgi:hypothetical protein
MNNMTKKQAEEAIETIKEACPHTRWFGLASADMF